MGCVDGFVTEDAIDGEVFGWTEGLFLGEEVEHVGGDGGGVGAENEFLGFADFPVVLVAVGIFLLS